MVLGLWGRPLESFGGLGPCIKGRHVSAFLSTISILLRGSTSVAQSALVESGCLLLLTFTLRSLAGVGAGVGVQLFGHGIRQVMPDSQGVTNGWT